MKRFILILTMIISLQGLIKAQEVVFDPTLAGTIVAQTGMYSMQFNDIKNQQMQINNMQIVNNMILENMKKLEEKMQKALTNVAGVVQNVKDIQYCYKLAQDINTLIQKTTQIAGNDPELLILAGEVTGEVTNRVYGLLSYIGVATLGGEKNMLNNKERIDFIIHVKKELELIKGNIWRINQIMEAAKRNGFWQTLSPQTWQFVNNGQQYVNDIINNF